MRSGEVFFTTHSKKTKHNAGQIPTVKSTGIKSSVYLHATYLFVDVKNDSARKSYVNTYVELVPGKVPMSKERNEDILAGPIAEDYTMEDAILTEEPVNMEEKLRKTMEKPVRYTHDLRVVFQRRTSTSRKVKANKQENSVFDATEAMQSLCKAFFTIKDLSLHDVENKSFEQITNFPTTERDFKNYFDCTGSESGNMEVYCTISTSMTLPQVKFDSELYSYLMTHHIYLYPKGYTKAH
jgi:hypothetical protein